MPGTSHTSRRPVLITAILAVLAALTIPAGAASSGPGLQEVGFQGEFEGPPDFDRRQGSREPTPAQEAAVQELGATATWNDFGTPRSLIRDDGYLATGLDADPVVAARTWLRQQRGLFRLSADAVESLEVIRVAPIGKGHAVLLRQRYDGLPAAAGGLVAVGVDGGRIAYVSSSLAGGEAVPDATVGLRQAFAGAAGDVGVTVEASDVSVLRQVDGRTRMRVDGLPKQQSVRLVAVPTPQNGVRPAFQTFLWADDATAFTHFVDARTGQILVRLDEVDHAGEPNGTCSKRIRRSTTRPRIRGRRGAGPQPRTATS
jgi:extracellular elastinolytic metalloproteinase